MAETQPLTNGNGQRPVSDHPVIQEADILKTENKAAEGMPNDGLSASVTLRELNNLRTKDDLAQLFRKNNADPKKVFNTIKYEEDLEVLQIELVKLQRWVQDKGIFSDM